MRATMVSSDPKGRTRMTTVERRRDDRAGYPPPALTVAVLALITLALAVCTVVVIGDTVGRAFASYTPVEASVVDEHTEQRIVADRRGNNTDVVRIVTVELPEGIRADVPSDDLAVGSDATVYLSGSGAVFASPPPPPSVLEWALCALVLTATIVLGVVTVRAAGRLRRAPE